MAKTNDKVVAQIYETYEYDKFRVVSQNRGHQDTNGVKDRKVTKLQNLLNTDRFVPEKNLVWVNEDYLIVEGRHSFEVRKNNKMPIRYTFIKDERFNNGTSRRQLVGNIYNINTINTAWSSQDFFNSAVQTRAPLAIEIQKLLDKGDGSFKWLDVMAVLTGNEIYFNGRFQDLSMDTFEDKDLIEKIYSREFKAEFEYFKQLNQKARIAVRRSPVLTSCYQIINKASALIDLAKFRKASLKVDDSVLESVRFKNMKEGIRTMIKQYNKNAGANVQPEAVIMEITAKFRGSGKTSSLDEAEDVTREGFTGRRVAVGA